MSEENKPAKTTKPDVDSALEAWFAAKTDEDRRAAVKKYPELRERFSLASKL